MAEYTALVEAGNAIVELLRERMTPEPISNGELIALRSPHESENSQLTVWLFHIEEDSHNTQAGYYQYSKDVQRIQPSNFQLSFLITAHSKAPANMREADQYRIVGSALQVIKDEPLLEAKFLSGSLLETNAQLHLSVERPNFDQMIKIWNNTASPYKLSVVCKAVSVAIDSKRMRRVGRVSDVAISFDQSQHARETDSRAAKLEQNGIRPKEKQAGKPTGPAGGGHD